DIATEVVAHGKDPESVPVGKVMRRKPAVIRAEAGVLDAAQMFARTGVRRLPVVAKDGTLLGIITMDDILILLGNEMGHISAALAAGLRRAS
ncbi:MAG TPA: CBS domain-containing protein, partial [Candidatus Methylomirabilis sp.]|nr:CBS domain-containing protein [Candidatus Methylomirabilis sp.]